MMRQRILPPLLFFLLCLLTLEFLVRGGVVESTLIPSPSILGQTFVDLKEDFFLATTSSLTHALIGWIFSGVIGLILALIFSSSRVLRQAVLPFAVFFQTVPIIAIAPLLVIYFGFGGTTVVAASFIVSVFPVLASALVGLNSSSQAELDLFQIYQASPLKVLLKLRLPRAYPYLYSGLKISAGLAIVGVVAGEFVAGGGLGAMIDAGRTQQRVDIVFVALLLLSVMGLLILGILRFGHFLLSQNRPLMRGE